MAQESEIDYYAKYRELMDVPLIANDVRYALRTRMRDLVRSKGWRQPYQKLGYLKALELYKYVGTNPKTAFFNAEFPGGFMFAARDTFDLKDWRASTFYPESTQVTGSVNDAEQQSGDVNFLVDKFGAYSHNKDKWFIGEMNIGGRDIWVTGDMTSAKDIYILVSLVRTKFELVDLYTADGYVSLPDADKIEAEKNNLKLLAGEILCAIYTVAPGGACIIKIIGGELETTHKLIAIIGEYFNKLEIFKPALSSIVNLEFYVIGKERNEREMDFSLSQIRKVLDFNLETSDTSRQIGEVLKKINAHRLNLTKKIVELIEEGDYAGIAELVPVPKV